MGQMREDALIAMADEDAENREREEQEQLNDLFRCHTVNDLKAFIMKHIMGI